ncbi:Hypp8065 [Branchiostoma lanceolatum]|nr:Hypp8065 [Branchiostoma lanceolatum]
MIVESDGTAETILDWPTGFVVAMADVHSEQFKARMSLISYGLPGQHRGPSAVKITDLRPGDALTGGRYFQFRQPGDARGPPMDLRVFAITVSASPNPATIGQKVALTCSVEGGSPDRFTWTHEETGQTISETRDPQGKSYTAEFTAKPDSEGSYICTVSGSIGQGRKSIGLHVGSIMVTTVTTPTPPTTPTLQTSASSVSAPTEEKVSTTKTSINWTLGMKPVQQLAKESDKVSTEAIIACVFGGLILMIIVAVVVVVAWVLRRKRREREIEEENAGNGDAGRQNEEMLLPQLNDDNAGTRTQMDFSAQTTSLRSSYEEEQNTINSRKPLLAKERPKLHISTAPTNADLDSHTGARSASTQTPVDSPTDQTHHLNEETSFIDEATATLPPDENTDPKAASSGRPVDRGTGQGSPANNRQRFFGASRSVSLDESTATEPHSLRSGHLNSRNCPQLEDMISYDARSEPTQNDIPANTTRRPSNEQNKEVHPPEKATSCRESTQLKGGFRASMETMMEDTIEEDGGGGQVSNREGRRFDESDLRAMSLNGNEVATTIDKMIRKVLADVGNLDLPYRKFSELCLQLYSTQNNWKVLADRLGLTSGDILLIDNCSTQHNLPAAEIVLRHWQRTSSHDRATCPPCSLQNLRTILQDMGREDLVSLLQK